MTPRSNIISMRKNSLHESIVYLSLFTIQKYVHTKITIKNKICASLHSESKIEKDSKD